MDTDNINARVTYRRGTDVLEADWESSGGVGSTLQLRVI